MATTLDYESIEIYLGDRLRRLDNLDIHSDNFFPVSLLDLLFHYSEESRGTELDHNCRTLHRNFHGHDFDRWIDNIVARTTLPLADEDGETTRVQLIDIDAITFDSDSTVTVTLPDSTTYRLLTPQGTPLQAKSIADITPAIDLSKMFALPPADSDSTQYLGFGTIAHILRVVCEKSNIDPTTADPHDLSRRLFDHFKHEMLPLIPSLWNDMEHIMHYATPTLHT